jgi:hypothetical protein
MSFTGIDRMAPGRLQDNIVPFRTPKDSPRCGHNPLPTSDPNPQHIRSLSAIEFDLTGAVSILRREVSVQGSITEPFTPVQSPAAWYAADYRDSDEWIYRLTSEDLAEIEAAVAEVEASGAHVQVPARTLVTLVTSFPSCASFAIEQLTSKPASGASICSQLSVRLLWQALQVLETLCTVRNAWYGSHSGVAEATVCQLLTGPSPCRM